MLFTIIIATFFVGLVSLVGILLITKKTGEQKNFRSLISLAAGSLLAVAFLDLLPEAMEAADGVFEAHDISAVVLLSVLVFFLLERILHWHHCSDEFNLDIHGHHQKTAVFLNLIGDAVHNIIDGFLIAGAFLLDFNVGVTVTLAVILHEIPQEISDFGVLLYGGLSRGQAGGANILVALTAVIGAIVFYFFGGIFGHLIPIMAAVAVGNFIYLAMADLIPELLHENNRRKVILHTAWVFIGAALIYGVTIFLPHAPVA